MKVTSEAYLELCQTSNMELFAKIVNEFQLLQWKFLTNFEKFTHDGILF